MKGISYYRSRKLFGLIFFVFLFANAHAYGQEDPLITLDANQTSLPELFAELEQQTGYSFFYLASWVQDINVNGVFVDEPFSEILADLLNETELNYFITEDKKVIITRNSKIYDTLPTGFFPETDTVSNRPALAEKKISAPVFFNEPEQNKEIPMETVRIGKEELSSAGKKYTLEGYITNAVTGEVVENLAVVVEGSTIGTSTNASGYYELRLIPGTYIILTKSISMEDVGRKVVLYGDGSLNFELKEDMEVLGEVFLESAQNINIEETATGTETVDVENVKNIPLVLGERDILKVAATLPGITTAGEGAAGYNVRGGKADQNLILLDEAVIYNPAHFFGIFSALNPFTSGSFDIYKGSIPAEYGGRLSSVFDISTRAATTDKFGAEAAIGPVTANIVLETPISEDKAGVLIGGRATYSDWILRSLDEPSLQNSEASFYDAIVSYNHVLSPNDNLKATGYYSKDQYSITSDSIFGYSNRLASLQWDHRFNDDVKGKAVLSNSRYEFDIGFESPSQNNFDVGYSIEETQLKFHSDYKLNSSNAMNGGVSAKIYTVNPGSRTPTGSNSAVTEIQIPEERALEGAVYLSDRFSIGKKFEIDAGIRYSWFSALGENSQRRYAPNQPLNNATVIDTIQYGANEVIKIYGGPEFRVSGRYLLAPDLALKASYNNTIQYIHTLNNNTSVSPTDTWKLSDLNIKPQRGNQVSLGIYKNVADPSLEISLEGYYKKSQDILDFKTGAELLLNPNVETVLLQGEGKSYGAELLIKKKKGRLNGWFGYSYSRALIKLDSPFPGEAVNDGEFFPSNFDKPHDFSAVANYKFTKRFSASANFVYQTGRPITYPVGKYILNNAEYVLYGDRNAYRIPDFYRLDLSFNVEGNHKLDKLAHSFWSISIYNVLGRANPYSVFFVTEEGQVKAFQSSIFSIPVPTITYNLKF